MIRAVWSRMIGRFRAAPLGLAGALALILAVEGQFLAGADRLATYQGLAARFALAGARHAARDCGVLGLGDSVMKFGFDPAEIERRTGLKAYNLAVPATPPPLTYALLRRALDAGARPSAVVISHMTLSGDPWAYVAELSEVLGPLESADLARMSDDSSLFGGLATRELLPSLRYRHAIRIGVVAGLGGGPAAAGRHVPGALIRSWEADRGMERHEADGTFDGRMEPNLVRSVYSSPWRVFSAYEKYVRRITKLADKHGITVFWLVTPIAPEAQAHRDALGLDTLHTKNLRAILDHSPRVVILDSRHAGYPAKAFIDSCHLNAKGAARLSAEVADAIQDRLGQDNPDRWVTLAPYADPLKRLTGDKDVPHRR